MAEGTEKLRAWAASNREQASEGVKYFQARADAAGETPKAALEAVIGAFLTTLADAWDAIATAAE